MPYIYTQVAGATTYTKYVDPSVWVILDPPNTAGAIVALRALDPPKGFNGALAIVGTITACSAAGSLYIWDDACVTADNGTTIIEPDAVLAITGAGRWIKMVPA